MATIALATVSGQIDLQRWWFGLAVPARSFKVAG
jgi:hypothetical protein